MCVINGHSCFGTRLAVKLLLMHKEDISEERLKKAAEEMGMTFETFCEQMNTICREEEKERKNQGYAYSLSA